MLFMHLLRIVEQNYKAEFIDLVRADAQWVSGHLARDWRNGDPEKLRQTVDDLLLNGLRMAVEILDTDGRGLVAVGNPDGGWPETFREDFAFAEHGDMQYHIASAIAYSAENNLGTVRLSYDESFTEDEIKTLYARGLALAVAYLMAMLVATALLGNYLTRSLRRLGAAAHRVAEGQFDQRFGINADVREVVQLAGDLESMRRELVSRGQKLADREKRMRTIMENVADAIIAFDESGRIESCNSATLPIFGYRANELVGENISTLLADAADPVTVSRLVRPGHQEVAGVRRDGSSVPIEAAVSEFRQTGQRLLLGVLRDVSERKRAEEERNRHRAELAHAGRLSSLGEMSAGLAHELNQPLAAINMYIQGSLNRCKDLAGSCAHIVNALDAASRQAQRAGEIIRRIRGFIRKDTMIRCEEDINKLIQQTVELVDIDSRRVVSGIHLELADRLPPVKVDAMQIKQVLVNLIRNAYESMVNIAPEQRKLLISTNSTADGLVQVAVEDKGEGIAENIVDSVFEPFFTTKPNGIGLGLSISSSIVEEHGGRLWNTPGVGGGTRFSFTLPTSEKETP